MILTVITPSKNKGVWVLNENVIFDYFLCLVNVFESVDISFLRMTLPIWKMVCMHIEDNEVSVFIVPPSKRDQSLIVFGRGQAPAITFRESDDDLDPIILSLCVVSTLHNEKNGG